MTGGDAKTCRKKIAHLYNTIEGNQSVNLQWKSIDWSLYDEKINQLVLFQGINVYQSHDPKRKD